MTNSMTAEEKKAALRDERESWGGVNLIMLIFFVSFLSVAELILAKQSGWNLSGWLLSLAIPANAAVLVGWDRLCREVVSRHNVWCGRRPCSS